LTVQTAVFFGFHNVASESVSVYASCGIFWTTHCSEGCL